ncbi:MAG TPA: DinB family protein [Ktedonobacterales bacterium]|nr:DinB family protein [Ktedonobacterales bacterium]
MNAIALLRGQLKSANSFLVQTLGDVTSEQARWTPPGTAHPIVAIFAHGIYAEDYAINELLRGERALYASSFEGRTGIGDPSPYISPEWARGLAFDREQALAYAAAVAEATDAYVATLSDDDLDREIDLTAVGWGKSPRHFILSAIVLAHLNNMSGEVSCLKGLQGLKGYPI